MSFLNLADIASRETVPGYVGKFIHSDNITISFFDIEAGAESPEHAHPHEQFTMVLEGQFELTVDGEPHVMEPGIVVMIPGNVPHSGRAITACRLCDVFHPVREEYR
ncbi:MAG: cupin domain-containing protein [Chloroflexi bacterium]|nr:cupin domain-containing protein [Chloroflexota bacterium]